MEVMTMRFKNDGGLFEAFRGFGSRGGTAKRAMAVCNAASPANKHIDIATVYRFLRRHEGEFDKVKGRRFVLRSVKSNVIPFEPKAKQMKDPNHLSKVQAFVHEGFKQHAHAQTEGLTTEDLDRLLRQADPENILGPVEKRRVAHATTKLKQLGLIEQCGSRGASPHAMGLYRAATPKQAPEPDPVAAEVIPVTRAADVAAQKKGVVLRRGEWAMECPPDMSPEDIAKLMNELATKAG